MMPRGTVFLVDDDPSVRRALQRLLQGAGYDVESFADAAGYLARAAPTRPACIVLDLRMPGMTGLDLQSAISGTARALPVVFITGHGDDEVREQAMGSGAVDVLFKPIDEEVLMGAIEKALRAGTS